MRLNLYFLASGDIVSFPSYIISSIYISALLITSSPAIVIGEEAVGPLELISNVLPAVREFARSVYLEAQLERLGEQSNLYRVPENENNDILKNLFKDPEAQKLMKECKELHVEPVCKNSLYRTIDGTCNNLNYPEWGRALIEQDRFLPASYEGTFGMRRSISGEDLPLPRSISLKMLSKNNPSRSVSALFVFFGQFVAHDLSLSPDKTNIPTKCCENSGFRFYGLACSPIMFSEDDPFYSRFNVTCKDFIRSVPQPKCNLEKRDHLNRQTSFLDVSNTYGVNDTESQIVRTNDESGRLRSQVSVFGELMPKTHVEDKLFCPYKEKGSCFEGGDERINQHTMIMILQTIYLRLHNIFANKLRGLNPHWNGEKVYQESRRIIGALHQYLIYKEFLPHLVGPENMEKYDLTVNFKERSLYNDTLKPTLLTEFSTAAFRLHSMIPTEISKNYPTFRFSKSYSNLNPLYRGQLASLLSGSSEVASQKNDRYQMEDVSNFLYGPQGATYGFDLTSIDIMRGRDRGLPPYIDVVKKCSDGSIVIREFSDLNQTMTKENIELIRSIYTDVRDVDLWIGIVLETALDKSVTGPTAACISSIQFHRLKFGDSFYFTHTNGRYPFTKEQLASLKTYSLAKFLCETTGVTMVRRSPLLLPSKKNDLILCESLSHMNLIPWKEQSAV